MHGRTSAVLHNERGIFERIPNPVTVCRYHSLIAEESSLPSALEVTARGNDGVVMAIRHREAPVFGLQFHPEAILTEHGYAMLANFLRLAGIEVSREIPLPSEECVAHSGSSEQLPAVPVTF
jgi:anthranilate/para-aminobenzoate synthase component II